MFSNQWISGGSIMLMCVLFGYVPVNNVNVPITKFLIMIGSPSMYL